MKDKSIVYKFNYFPSEYKLKVIFKNKFKKNNSINA